MQIQIDITGVAHDERFNPGNKLSDLHNIGIVPDAIDGGRSLHVSNWNGSRVVVRDYQTDETIVSGNGWGNAMQALADHYGVPVQVSRDYGVTGGKSGKVLGLWAPATPAASSVAPAPALPKLNKAQAEFMRMVQAKQISFVPTNREWAAPSHAHRDMFVSFQGMRKSNRTIVGTAVFHMDLIDIEGRSKIVLTELGLAWLAAHPA
jgi:hypothetical protein